MSYEKVRAKCVAEIVRLAKDHKTVGNMVCANVLYLAADNLSDMPLPEVTDNGAIKSKLVANMIRYTCATKRQAKAIVDGCFDGDSVINISDMEDVRNPYYEIEALRKENAQLRTASDALSKRCYIMSESHRVNDVRGARLIVGFNNIVDADDAHSAISALKGSKI